MKNKLRLLIPAAVAAMMCMTVFCTIRDQNGDLVDPGTEPGSGGDGNNGNYLEAIDSSDNPVIVVSRGANTAAIDSNYYVRTGDTITLSIQLKADTAANAPAIKGAKVAVSMTPNVSTGYLSSKTLTTDSRGVATVKFSSSVAGQTELAFKCGDLVTTIQVVAVDGNDNAVIVVDRERTSSLNAYADSMRIGDTVTLRVQLRTDIAPNSEVIKEADVAVSSSDTANHYLSSKTLKTNKQGVATVKFSSSVVGLAELKFKYDDISTSLYLIVTDTTKAALLVVGLAPNDLADSSYYTVMGDTISLRALLKSDTASGAPGISYGMVRVIKSTNSGHITPASVYISDTVIVTDKNGVANVKFSSATTGRTELIFEYGTLKSIVKIIVSETPSRDITITASPSVLLANGSDKSTITVQVRNNAHNPLVGDTIKFTSSAGIITAVGVTDSEGKAIAQLTSDKRNDVALVTATLWKDGAPSNLSIPTTVEFGGVTITAVADPSNIKTGGTDSTIVVATLRDASGNAIVGERVTFESVTKSASTIISPAADTTNSRGEARATIKKTGVGTIDSIVVWGANARGTVPITFTDKDIVITLTPNNTYIADPIVTTSFGVAYKNGNTNIGSSVIEVTVTMGSKLTPSPATEPPVFVRKETSPTGEISCTFNNPGFSDTATIRATAYTLENGIRVGETTKDVKIYFRASAVKRIDLIGSPAVITINNGRTMITATAYDNLGNRVQGETISFNMLNGPGGGEYIAPATAVTGVDGTARTYLYAGSIPSMFKSVEVIASDFANVRSNVVNLTIAGPPKYITIRRNMDKVIEYPATYGKQFSVIVTDVNSNPVADGTEVTFSAEIINYVYYSKAAGYVKEENNSHVFRDTLAKQNFIVSEWPLNSVYKYTPYPEFEDINKNGRPDRYIPKQNDTQNPVEPCATDPDISGSCLPLPLYPSLTHADYNNNSIWDKIEEFKFCKGCLVWNAVQNAWVLSQEATNNPAKFGRPTDVALLDYLDSLYNNDPSSNTARWHMDWNNNGAPDPSTAVTITRTIQTKDGIADNELIYGQSDAWRIQVKVWAEAQGLVTSSPEQFVLPLAESAEKYWHPFE